MSRSRGDSGRKRGRGRGRAIVLDNEASIPNRGRARGRLGRISLEDEQIGHVQQERLEEENEQRNGPVAEEELLVTTEESEAAETESKAPPGKQIPLFTVNTYPTWRKSPPILAAIARDLFGIPASSGSIERVFSTASDIMLAKKNRTKADLLEKILFIKRNYKL